MRWVLDIIAVLTAAGLVAAVVTFQQAQGQDEQKIVRAASDLRRIELEIKYRAVTKSAPLNEYGWPVTVDPAWFDNDPPRNTLVTPKRPWVEIAGEAEAKLMQPRVRLAVDETLAGFWYNPYQGVVRARVPVLLSDQDTLNLYNRLNGSSLRSVFEREGALPRIGDAPTPADVPSDAPAASPEAQPGPAASDRAASMSAAFQAAPKRRAAAK